MKKIKVLFFISSLAGGGAERVMVEILHHIDKNKVEPVLILLYPYEDSPYKEHLPENIKVIVVGRKSNSPIDKIKQFISFIKAVHREKPHVILSMLTHNNIMAILSKIFLRSSVIVCEHNTLSEVTKTEEGKKIFGLSTAFCVKVLYRFANRIIAVSFGIKDNLTEEFKISPEKIDVIYNPIDESRIAELSNMPAENLFIKNEVPVVIAMGRLTWQKGFDVLLRAFSKVLKEVNAQLIVMGEGIERGSLERLAVELGVNDRVSLPGFQKNPYPFLSNADIFVLSSRYEGLPMAILEAMACGLPVIATDCRSGPKEILENGKYGLLVPVEDDAAMACAILKFLKDSQVRHKYSMLSRQRALDFSSNIIIKEYEKLIMSFS